MTQELRQIKLSELYESPTNPRKHYDKKAMADLTRSIEEKGVLVPLIVRKALNVFEIVAGSRRFRAAMSAKVKDVPCVIRDMTDIEVLEAQVIENDQREGVHPLEQSNGYKAMLESEGYDIKKIAARVGRSESFIYQRLKLADLIPPAQKLFYEEKMEAGHAILVARLTQDQQSQVVQWFKQRENWSVRGLATEIEQRFHLRLSQAPFDINDAELVPAAGSCATCPKRSGANKLLFADIKEGDTCTDPTCFEQKCNAFVKIAVGTHQDARLLTVGGTHDGFQHKGEIDWKRTGKQKCKDAVQGIIVQITSTYNGNDGKLGELIEVCMNEKCKIHHPMYANYASNGRSRVAEKKRKLELKRRRIVFRQLVNAKKWTPQTQSYDLANEFIINNMANDSAKAMCESLEWVPARAASGKYDFREIIKKKIETPRLFWLPILAIAATELWTWPGNSMKSKVLDSEAKKAKIDLTAIAKLAAQRVKTKAKPAAKLAESKSKSKKKGG